MAQGQHRPHQTPHGKGPGPVHPTPSRFVGGNILVMWTTGSEQPVWEGAICLIRTTARQHAHAEGCTPAETLTGVTDTGQRAWLEITSVEQNIATPNA